MANLHNCHQSGDTKFLTKSEIYISQEIYIREVVVQKVADINSTIA